MDPARRAEIIDAIHDARGRVKPLQVAGLDIILVGRAGDNYLLLLPEGPVLSRAERRWLHNWHGHAEACWTVDDALSAIEARFRARMAATEQDD